MDLGRQVDLRLLFSPSAWFAEYRNDA